MCVADEEPMTGRFKSRLKKERGFRCQVCGGTFKLLQIHHIDKNHNNNNKGNLMVVCPECHKKFHPKESVER